MERLQNKEPIYETLQNQKEIPEGIIETKKKTSNWLKYILACSIWIGGVSLWEIWYDMYHHQVQQEKKLLQKDINNDKQEKMQLNNDREKRMKQLIREWRFEENYNVQSRALNLLEKLFEENCNSPKPDSSNDKVEFDDYQNNN